ncbi:hypothetical protein IFO70_19270 [Phormidium tenue FACHB-886]|nr:hypothetical protein [Phormidium tenue FACHB-886]
MFKPGFIKSLFLAYVQQPLLNGIPLVNPEPVLRSVPAVRIPGGLTPP